MVTEAEIVRQPVTKRFTCASCFAYALLVGSST